MDNYVPSDETTEEPTNPFPAPYNQDDAKMMIYFTENPDRNRFVLFKSSNGATERAISCVEVLKQQFKEPLYQWTSVLCSKRVILWKCLQEGPRDIRVTVEVPVIFIIISRDPFPGEYSCMSMQCSVDKDVAFLPAIHGSHTAERKTEKRKEKKGNRKSLEGNKWTKPNSEQRRKENEERHRLFKEIESSKSE